MISAVKKILLAMSGGTDSSVAAILLLEQGYHVEGVTLMTYSKTSAFINEAQLLAHKLGIRHHVMDVRSEFNKLVIHYFINEYQQGRTPNPCVFCNEHIKWTALARKADELGIEQVATGHYARVLQQTSTYHIAKGSDSAKDQSYFLWRLPQSILQRACFPLGELTKSEVRSIAVARGFKSLSEKKESMGVCFLENSGVSSFLDAMID